MTLAYHLSGARQIPLVGSTIYHAGKLYDLWATPCNAGWRITVEGFFAYAPTLIWGLYGPGLTETVKNRFGRAHSRRAKGKFIVKEFNQKVPVIKPGIYQISWDIANIVARIGWYLIIADATIDFLINWTSMVYAVEGCDVPNAAYADLDVRPGPVNWPFITSYSAFFPFNYSSSNIFTVPTPKTGIFVPPGYNVGFSAGCTIDQFGEDFGLKFLINRGAPVGDDDGIPLNLNSTGPDGSDFSGAKIYWTPPLDAGLWSVWGKASRLCELPVNAATFSASGAYGYGLKPVDDWHQYFKG